MAFPPSPGSFSPWRLDRAPRLLAPKGTTTGAFSHYRYGNERGATAYAAVSAAGLTLAGVMGGTGALAGAIETGSLAFSAVIPLTGGLVNDAFVQGGMLFVATVDGLGLVSGTVTVGSSLVAVGQRDDIVWRCGTPLRVVRPTTDTSTGAMSFWRLDRPAGAVQIGPPPEPPPEAFWRVGRPTVVTRPK